MNLKNEIQFAITKSASISELKSILVSFKENGGTKEDAHLELYELLQEASTEFEDTMIRELLDFTIGFSGTISTNWD